MRMIEPIVIQGARRLSAGLSYTPYCAGSAACRPRDVSWLVTGRVFIVVFD